MSDPRDVHPAVGHLRAIDPVLARVIDAHGAYTLEPRTSQSPFHSLAHAIAHQQLNGTAANTILRRFRALYGAHDAYPDPAALLATPDAQLRSVGFSTAKVAALKDLAVKALEGVVPPAAVLHSLDDDAIVARWAPHRSAASWYLWRAVDLAREGRLPPPVGKTRLPRVVKRRPVRKVAAPRGRR